MYLKEVFNPEIHKGLNFNLKIKSPVLEKLMFENIFISTDMRDNTALLKIQKRIKDYTYNNKQVFMVQSPLVHHDAILTSVIHGLTGNLPYIVYFRKTEDPDFIKPLVYSLEEVRWKSSAYAKLIWP